MNIKQYLTHFIEKCQHLDDTAFVDVEAEDISSLYLVKVEEENYNEKESEMQPSVKEATDSYELQTISSIISSEQHLIILGNPGSGKSTTLVHEAIKMANDYLHGYSTNIPIYMALKNIISLADFKNSLNIEQQETEDLEALSFHNYVLFLDGLNELSPNIYESIIDAIKRILCTYPNVKLVLSSRKYGYTNQLAIPQYELQAFDEENIGSYIKMRTGNIQLLAELRKEESLFSLCSTPLILKMVVDTWLANQHLPAQISSLYQEFIDNQISENLHLNNKDKQLLISTMSVLAYKLRDTGFISDSTLEMKNIIGYYLEEENKSQVRDINHLSDLLMRSGLLVIYDRGNGFQYISFMHETFQEYFCSLYVAQQYLAHKKFCIDITNCTWKETMRMAMEIIVPQLNNHQAVELLKTIQKAFIGENDNAIDMHLVRYIEILDSCTSINPIIAKWLEQYTQYNMNNYMAQHKAERSIQQFAVIIEAITKMRSKSLYKMLFRDLNGWMKEWLYADEELRYSISTPLKNSIWKKEHIVAYHACWAKAKPLLLQEIILAEKNNRMLKPVMLRLQDLKQKLIMSIYGLEAKRIFEESPSLFFLLMSKDQSLIMSMYEFYKYDINTLTQEQRVFIRKKYTLKGCLNLLEFYYNWILPKYNHLDEEHLDSEMTKDIRRSPKLMDSLLLSEFWQKRLEWLIKVIYHIPEVYWTDTYKKRQNILLESMVRQESKKEKEAKPLTYKLECKGKWEDEYIYEIAPGQNIKKKTFFRLTETHTITPNFQIVMMMQIIIKKFSDEEKENVIHLGLKRYEWDRFFQPLEIIDKTQEGDTISYLFRLECVNTTIKANSIVTKGKACYYLAKIKRINMILSTKEADHINLYPAISIGIAWDKMASDYYYLVSRSKLLYNKQSQIDNMGKNKLAERGWLGCSPKAIKEIAKNKRNFYLITQKLGENKYEMIQATSQTTTLCNHQVDYFTCQEGDIVMEYKNTFWKMETLATDLSLYGFRKGTITNIKDDALWLKDPNDNRFICSDPISAHKIGEVVTFWPTGIISTIDKDCKCALRYDNQEQEK